MSAGRTGTTRALRRFEASGGGGIVPAAARLLTTRRAILLAAVAAFVVLVAMTQLGFSRLQVTGASMEPTLNCAAAARCRSFEADSIVANSWYYRLQPVRRGDIVVIRSEPRWCEGATTLVKRVVALAGQTVRVSAAGLYVDGKLVRKGRAHGPGSTGRERTLVVPPSRYYVAGDSPASCDSGSFGPIPRSRIAAKVIAIYSPLSRLRFL